jgi:NDP-sugar pyrophosphorylase family protein
VDSVWVNLHYRAEEVRRAVEAMGLAIPVCFSYEDPILGTAGAWRSLAGGWAGTSLVVYGDNLTWFDLGRFRAAHHRAVAEGGGRVLATVALFDPGVHSHTGIAGSRVRVAEDGRVAGFEEVRGGEAGRSLVSTGACLLEPAAAERVAAGFADFGADIFPNLVRDGALAAHVIEPDGFCLGLDTPAHFEAGVRLVESGAVALPA